MPSKPYPYNYVKNALNHRIGKRIKQYECSLGKDGFRSALHGLGSATGGLFGILDKGKHRLRPDVHADVGHAKAAGRVDEIGRIGGRTLGEAIDDGLVLLLGGILGSGPEAAGILLAEEAGHGSAVSLLEGLHVAGRGGLACGDGAGDVVPGLTIGDGVVDVPERRAVEESNGSAALRHVDRLAKILAERQAIEAHGSVEGVDLVGGQTLREGVNEGLECGSVDVVLAPPDAYGHGTAVERGQALMPAPHVQSHRLVDRHVRGSDDLEEALEPFTYLCMDRYIVH